MRPLTTSWMVPSPPTAMTRERPSIAASRAKVDGVAPALGEDDVEPAERPLQRGSHGVEDLAGLAAAGPWVDDEEGVLRGALGHGSAPP